MKAIFNPKSVFFIAGILIGTLFSGLYLYYVNTKSVPAGVTPDSFEQQILYVGLIYFAVIVQCRLIGRFVTYISSKGDK
ncbi:MAG: hypothetical protein FWD70_07310 [Desulfuromonadales bacterium]|nr:hypothetical protein [Desulfuromonadales bacterium]